MENSLYTKINVLSTQTINTIYQSIANYVLKNITMVKTLGIEKLAERTYTSKTTVLRFCKNLGLSGYKEFITEIKNLNRFSEPWFDDNQDKKPCDAYKDLIIKNINKIYDQNLSSLYKIKELFKNTKDVYLFGFGKDALILEYFKWLFYNWGFNIHYSSSLEIQKEYIQKFIKPGGVMIFMTFNGISNELDGILKDFKPRSDTSIITFSANDSCPIWNMSDIKVKLNYNESVQKDKCEGFVSCTFLLNLLNTL